MKNTLFQEIVKRGIAYDNHESDLYIPANAETYQLLKDYKQKGEQFKCNIDGKLWFDVPFAFDNWWLQCDKMVESWACGVTK